MWGGEMGMVTKILHQGGALGHIIVAMVTYHVIDRCTMHYIFKIYIFKIKNINVYMYNIPYNIP